jgi:hypothetical protein
MELLEPWIEDERERREKESWSYGDDHACEKKRYVERGGHGGRRCVTMCDMILNK